MTKTKSTKRALLLSALSLLMCVSMLIGSTFAWFTDSVTSGRNKIVAGNLDIVLEYKTPESDDWAEVTSDTVLFSEDSLWEPGHTEVVALRIRNAGTLALKFDLATTVYEEVAGTNVAGETFKLSDYLEVGYSPVQQAGTIGDILMNLMLGNRDNAASLTNSGFGESVENTNPTILPGASHVCALAITMPTTVGNEANYKTGTEAPYISFGVTVVATQATVENDSFDNQYDATANYDALQQNGNTYSLLADVTLTDAPIYSNTSVAEAVTINGNGATVTGVATSIDAFEWDGNVPLMSTIFSSEGKTGALNTVNDITFTGTMSAVMAGQYINSDSNWFNTEFNNVNIIDAEVVSFSAGIAPALCVYGNMTMNNCVVTGTTLSALDTEGYTAYDVAVVNYSDTVINDSKIGSLYMWNQAKVTVAEGSEIDTIVIRGNMNATKYGLTVKAGATVGKIDLTNITNVARVNITIEDGATVGAFVDNGVEYTTLDAWKAAQ